MYSNLNCSGNKRNQGGRQGRSISNGWEKKGSAGSSAWGWGKQDVVQKGRFVQEGNDRI